MFAVSGTLFKLQKLVSCGKANSFFEVRYTSVIPLTACAGSEEEAGGKQQAANKHFEGVSGVLRETASAALRPADPLGLLLRVNHLAERKPQQDKPQPTATTNHEQAALLLSLTLKLQ